MRLLSGAVVSRLYSKFSNTLRFQSHEGFVGTVRDSLLRRGQAVKL
jgi:hypothetical protein